MRKLRKRLAAAGMTLTLVMTGTAGLPAVYVMAGSLEIEGGALVKGNTCTITEGGTYTLSGSQEQGQIYIEAEGEEVTLVLQGVTLTNPDEPVIYVKEASSLHLVLEEGTENFLQSGEELDITAETADEDAKGGAVFAKCDMDISGSGSLEVRGYLNNGIHCSNNLTIDSGELTVIALNNGVKSKETMTLNGGSLNIVSGGDSIQAEMELAISDGSYTVYTGNGSASVNNSSENGWFSGWDMEDSDSPSRKGIKSDMDITISGGIFDIDTEDDGIHSDANITISGGSFLIQTGDDGIHADDSILIQDGDITIGKSCEGIEANQITVEGGDISVTSGDDGFNANGGSNSSGGFEGFVGKDSKRTGIVGGETGDETAGDIKNGDFRGSVGNSQGMDPSLKQNQMDTDVPEGTTVTSASQDEVPELRITGGNIYVNADGDGLDSNGDIYIEGGTVAVDGPSGSGNGALDYGSERGGVCMISGGTVIAVGASGMAETFSQDVTQCSFEIRLTSSFQPDTLIQILDRDGKVLYEHTAAKSGNDIVFSSPELTLGETYTIVCGSQQEEITLDSITTSSGQSGMGGIKGRR